MTDPTPAVMAAFAWLDRLTGIGHGDVAIHAAVLKGYHDAMACGWYAMRAERNEARAAADALAVAAQRAVDEGGSLADVVAAIYRLTNFDATADAPAEQRPSPRPRETAS